MGQKTNPIGLRLGIIRGWDSNWFGGKDFSEKLVEDEKIRKYIKARIPKGDIAKVVIERTLKRVTLTIHTARPGVVIGRGGTEVDRIKEELKKLYKKDIQINIYEVKRPQIDAKLVGEKIAQQLEGRISYRRAMKKAIADAIHAGAQGIKVKLSGRLAGADMARTEQYKEGRVPLHTLRADIDYAISEAQTVYGKIGIKVWVFKREIYGKPDLSPQAMNNASGSEYADRNDRNDQNRGGRNDQNRGRGDRDKPKGDRDQQGRGNNNNRNNNNANRNNSTNNNNKSGGTGQGGNKNKKR